jgi:hypothetical protein
MTVLLDPGLYIPATKSAHGDEDKEELESAAEPALQQPSRYCDKCDVLVPTGQQIRHCEDCGICVIGHDHHCPWIGKCIGRGNMR